MSTVVVIGGVAAGMSAASQAKRRSPDTEVIVLERGDDVSYGACGMPYNIEDPRRDIHDLVVVSADRFREERGIDLRLRQEVVAIDRDRKVVEVRDRVEGRTYEQAYDKLVIATGASARTPPVPGLELPGVFPLRELSHGERIKQWLSERPTARRVVIIGAGYIGMEMAEVFTARGLEVTVLEKLQQILPGWEREIVEVVGKELARHDVAVRTGVDVREVARRGEELVVHTDEGDFPADLVLVSIGVRPNAQLADEAGLALGAGGAIAVDAHQRTSDPDVFAAGDCAEAPHRLTGKGAYVPLGTTANKQGKIAGANAVGADEAFAGIVGTAGFKVFDLEVARTGLGESDVEALGLHAVRAASQHSSRAHGYPDPKRITTVLFAERGTGRLLGAQMVGGDAVAKRVDVFATALYAGLTLEDVESLDLSYAPPFAPVWDPVLIAATVARKQLEKAEAAKRAAGD